MVVRTGFFEEIMFTMKPEGSIRRIYYVKKSLSGEATAQAKATV